MNCMDQFSLLRERHDALHVFFKHPIMMLGAVNMD